MNEICFTFARRRHIFPGNVLIATAVFITVCTGFLMVYTVSIDTTTNRISYENHDSDHGFQNLQRYFLQKSSVTAVRPEPQNYYITSSIALGDLEKIRLKPWFGMKVFGSAVCPTRSSAKDLHSNRGENNTFVVWDTLEHRYSPEVCPKFTPCLGSVMPDISFCQLPWIKSGLVSERIRPPLLIISSKISFSTELSFDRFTLPWLAHVASVNRGVFVNVFGHIFSETRQYLHGGCQDETDLNHGGPPSYEWNDLDIKVFRFQGAINMIHIYGDNYYHFLIETVPRFLMILPLLKEQRKSGRLLPILVRSIKFLPLLKALLDIDPEHFEFYTIDDKKHLVYISDALFVPLAPRCLHSPKQLWRMLRSRWRRRFNLWGTSLPDKGQFKASTATFKSIIYASRILVAPRRHIRQESELLNVIRQSLSSGDRLTVVFGNETIETAIKTFSEANILIGPHGAGLSHMVFMRSGSAVLELHGEGYWNPCYNYLANALDIRLFSHKIAGGRGGRELSMSKSDFVIISNWIKQN